MGGDVDCAAVEVQQMKGAKVCQKSKQTTTATMLLSEVASRVFRPRQAALIILSVASQTVLLLLLFVSSCMRGTSSGQA
jgi:hypothetical protein